MMKTGYEHIQSLRDGRQVFLDGKMVDDVTTHPAFRNAVSSAGAMFEFASAEENTATMTYEVEETGERANRIWQLPRSYDELVTRRKALETWAELHCGFLGRSPAHIATVISGMRMGLPVFADHDPQRAGAFLDYYRFARDNDLFLTYVIINPQADRSKAAHEQADPHLTAAIVDRDHEGIVIKGAKMLGTSAIMSNEVLVTCIQPLKEGDEMYAFSFAMPLNAPGIKILSRKSYEAGTTNTFDNPLAHRFDENDAVIYFDEVKVPWERVFIVDSREMCQKQFHATPAHVYQNYEAQIRLMVKLRFLAGVAKRVTEVNGIDKFPQVREKLATIATQAATTEAFVNAMEAQGFYYDEYYMPNKNMLYSAQVVAQETYPKVIEAIRELAGGGMIMLPSSVEDFGNPELAEYIFKTQKSPTVEPYDRVKFFKLAWDAVGSEFASRHTQYEMFYAGAQFVVKHHAHRTYDWERAGQMVDDILNSYTLEDELQRVARQPEPAAGD